MATDAPLSSADLKRDPFLPAVFLVLLVSLPLWIWLISTSIGGIRRGLHAKRCQQMFNDVVDLTLA